MGDLRQARMSIAEACLFGLGIVGEPAAVADLCHELDHDYTHAQIKNGLCGLARRRPPLTERKVQGGAGYGQPTIWQLTDAGRAVLAELIGPDDDPDPARVPCGLGWPG